MEDILSNIDMNLDEFNLMFESAGESMEMMGSTDDLEISDKNIDEALSQIDSEILIEASDQLPSATGTKVSNLQDELARLKNKR